MRRIWLHLSLSIMTFAFLLCFVLTLLPALQNALLLIPAMVLLAIILVILHGYILVVTPRKTDNRRLSPQVMAVEKPIMLIVGPYAAKWFRQQGNADGSRFNHQLIWLLIPDAKMLALRLEKIRQDSPKARTLVFFPLLPDLEESATQIKINISHWQQQFTGVLAQHCLPTVLAVYAQLSNVNGDEQQVTEKWLNNIAIDTQRSFSPEEAIRQLGTKIDNVHSTSPQDTRRAVMSKQLLVWLTESGITQCLSSSIFPTSLRLSQLMLCDCSRGFHRHGAWSSWLAKHYALLPALSTHRPELPLPEIKLKPQPSQKLGQPARRERANTFFWSQGLVTLVLAASLVMTTVSIHHQQQDFYTKMQSSLSQLDNLSAVKLQRRITQLKALYTSWIPCMNTPKIRTWGLSSCAVFLNALNQRIAILATLPSYSTQHWRNNLFNSGSSTLLPQAIPQLEAIADLIRTHPHQKVVITGHADNIGSKHINDVIAAKRAEAVAQWLTQQGFDASLLITQTEGADEPIAPNDNAQGRQENRRVDIIILPSDKIMKEFTTL
ncbi:OmpA family protein [Rosenbergiella epipactidis]|uniref:OmpA family protein n=1 Tax=Rosenbergiella epipactidis TaxID=1544694 RepID=UPI001F4F945D|nr:OmpA family protein [Rosenbergiella epipactidis]